MERIWLKIKKKTFQKNVHKLKHVEMLFHGKENWTEGLKLIKYGLKKKTV